MIKHKKQVPKWIKLLLLATAVIAIYKTFDSLPAILRWLGYLFSLFLPICIGLILCFFLNKPVLYLEHWFQRRKSNMMKKHSRIFSLIVVYLLFISLITVLVWAILPMLFSSITNFLQQLPTYLELLKTKSAEWQKNDGLLAKSGFLKGIQSLSLSSILPASPNWSDPGFLKKCHGKRDKSIRRYWKYTVGICFLFLYAVRKRGIACFSPTNFSAMHERTTLQKGLLLFS